MSTLSKRIALAIILLALASVARADNGINDLYRGPGGGIKNFLLGNNGAHGGGGGCSNSLDFTKACNSQYVGVL